MIYMYMYRFQNGMDFVTEISFCKTPVADEKMLILVTEVQSQLGKSFKVSALKLQRQMHSHNLWLQLVYRFVLLTYKPHTVCNRFM